MKYIMITTPTDSRTLEVKKLISEGKIENNIEFIDFRDDAYASLLSEFGQGTIIDSDVHKEVHLKDLLK